MKLIKQTVIAAFLSSITLSQLRGAPVWIWAH
ncbi:hypothetical protein AAKU55_001193 [Oxalobacteraceae bacterium GrIS 1.11]